MYDRNYRSWHVYVANLAVALLFVLTAPVKAGTEIDQAGKDFHACIDANNCDNEIYDIITTGTGPNLQYAGSQSAEVNHRFKFSVENLPPYMQPFLELPYEQCIRIGTPGTDNGECIFYPVAAGETCTLTDVNGDARTVTTFFSQFTRAVEWYDWDYYNYLYLDVRVYCSDY